MGPCKGELIRDADIPGTGCVCISCLPYHKLTVHVLLQDAQHNSSTPVPSAQHSASMQGRQNAVPPPAFDQHHSLYPSSSSSVPVARKLASTVDVQKSSTEAEQRETSNSSKPDSRDVKPLAPSVGNGDHTSLKQNGLEQPQQPLDTHGKAQQPRQQRVNGLTNRHLSEEEDAEDAQHNKDDNASEASDGDDIEDEEDDEEEDEAAQSSYQVRFSHAAMPHCIKGHVCSSALTNSSQDAILHCCMCIYPVQKGIVSMRPVRVSHVLAQALRNKASIPGLCGLGPCY